MKAVSESTWSMQIMIFFILIFAAFLVLVLSYNKAYIIKNRMLSIIEKYEGITVSNDGISSASVINDFLYNKSYTNTGVCPEGWYGALSIKEEVSQSDFSYSDGKTSYYYCFSEENDDYGMIYYNIIVFYRFNLPVIGQIANYKIEGTTKTFVGNNDRIGSD